MADTVPVVDEPEALTFTPFTEIATPEQYVGIGGHIRAIKAYVDRVTSWFDGTDANPGPRVQAWKTYKSLNDKKNELLKPAQDERARCDKLLIAYDDAQVAIAAEKQKAAEAQALKDAETRQVEEAAHLETLANETGDEALREEAAQVLEQPIQADPVHVAVATPKVGGVSLRDNWKANRAAWNQQRDARLLIAAIIGVTDPAKVRALKIDPVLVNFLTANWTPLDAFAKSTKGTAKVPGVTFVNDRGVAARAR